MDTHPIERTLRDGLRETLDAEDGPHPEWAGSPAARRVAEHQRSRWPLRAMAAAAAVLVVAIGAYQFLPRGLGSGEATAALSPSPALLARGDFVIANGGYAVELEAFGQDASVTGSMLVSEVVSDLAFTVGFQCTRTARGLIMIAGVTTEGDVVAPEGTWAAIVIEPGSPVKARILSQRGGPASNETDCLGYLDEQAPVRGGMTGLVPIEGTIELGANSAPAFLPVGPHVMGGRWHGEDRVTVTIPAPGWFAADQASVTKVVGGGDRVTVTVVPGDYYSMPRNICDPRMGEFYETSTADQFVAGLAEQTYDTPDGSLTREFSAPEDITIDGSHGQLIRQTATAYPDSDPKACDEQRYCSLKDRDFAGCLLSHPEPGALDTLWVVDPPENRNYLLVVVATGSPSPALRDEMNTLVNSMKFYVE